MMRRSLILIVPVVLAFITATAATFGATEQKFNSGACEPPNARNETWWSVTTYVDGVPTKVSGRDCQGNIYWDRPINVRFISADPISGMTPTNAGANEDGTAWAAVIIYDASHDPIWMGGKIGEGRYWVADAIDLFNLLNLQ
jgi:hypothetical protein